MTRQEREPSRYITRPRLAILPVLVDEKDQRLFEQARWQPFATNITDLQHRGLTTTDQALYTYGMMLEWDSEHETTYREFKTAVPRFHAQYDEYVLIERSTVSFRRRPQGDIAERLGVGGSLAMASRVANVTEADFKKIPVSSLTTSFDYSLELSALGPDFELEVEAKGTHDGKSTNNQVASIRNKKATLRRTRKTLRLGCVVDICTTNADTSSITLVDPPEDGEEPISALARLIRRLQFYLRALRLITPAGRITVALANRIENLLRLPNEWARLDGAPLVGADGDPLPVDRFPSLKILSYRAPHFEAFVRPYPVTDEWANRNATTVLCYLHGLECRVGRALILQEHDTILDLNRHAESIEIQDGRMEGFVSRLPSGVVGGLAEVDAALLRRDIPINDAQAFRRRRRR